MLLTAACSNAPQDLTWSRIDLPADGPVVLSDVTDCGDRWWATGAVEAPDGTTRPAAWVGPPFTEVPFVPLPTSYYGPRQVIRSVACAGQKVAMVGATPGGAHGNPRVSTWWRRPDGRMAENPAPFETYGGDEAVDVGPITAGPTGFAIAGNRTSGAAAWFSPDGRTFTLDEPGRTITLSEPGRAGTAARDVVALPDDTWLVVGADRRAAGWKAGAGGWSSDAPASNDSGSEIQRAVRVGDDVLAAGASGADFRVWRRHDNRWRVTETFAGDPAGVRSLAVVGGRSVVVGGGLWIAGARQDTPADPVAVAARGDTLLLAGADSLWQTTVHR